MQTLRYVVWVGLVLMVAGCAARSKEAVYLQSAQDQATQEDVRQQMGAPKTVTTSQSGDSHWVYEVWTWQPGDYRIAAPGAWCDQYTLTFDQEAVLREWTHESYFHGGEAFPEHCVPAQDLMERNP